MATSNTTALRISISVPINENSLNISLNMKNVEISILIYMLNASHQPVAKLLKLAPLRPGLVCLAIFPSTNPPNVLLITI